MRGCAQHGSLLSWLGPCGRNDSDIRRRLLSEAADAGGYAYIVKPVNEREVLAAVELASARWNELQAAKEALETRKLVERAKGRPHASVGAQ